MTQKLTLSPEQDTAADPTKNIWVQANAGTGKTKVLVQRLLRILFRSPDCNTSGILCLTYTNAGAGEMRNRILRDLRNWANATDDELCDLLNGITTNTNVTDSDIEHARKIFFKYIDNPEILKIKTIHGFCEEILHRFPLEVNLSPSWTLVSDTNQHILQMEALRKMINSTGDVRVRDAFAHIVEYAPENYIDTMLDLLNGQYKYFFQVKDFDKYREYFIDTTKYFLNIHSKINTDFDTQELQIIADFVQNDINLSKKPADYMEKILKLTKQFIEKTIVFEEYKSAYLKSDGGKILHIFKSKKDPIVAEQEHVYQINQYLNNCKIFEDTIALFDLSAAFAKEYRKIKQQRNLLDFEDLILYTKELFSKPDTMGWVLSQLNISLSHILVDEAQDTSPIQWDILRMLTGDFFATGDTQESQHSLFVVGDTKQSIYGFQGADPNAFTHSQDEISTQIAQNMRSIEKIPLKQSFRSTAAVLNTVDRFFTAPAVTEATGFINNQHLCFRKKEPGMVEIHKLISGHSKENTGQTYTKNIADKIHTLVKTGKYQPKDIMILVQHRHPFAIPLLKELQKLEIPVAGSDRIVLPNFPAIRDLLNLIRFCLNQSDDFSLCCVLKSPLFRLTEADIYKICKKRNQESKILKKSLSDRHDITVFDILVNTHTDIFNKLTNYIKMSSIMGPYTFFSNILSPDVRTSFIAALGTQVIDPIEEFMTICLAYERTQPGTLYNFIKYFITGNSEIKRDLDASTGVRIVTVHGSKGLEAPVVFLIDTVNMPKTDEILPIPSFEFIKQKHVNTNDYPPVWIWTKYSNNTEIKQVATDTSKQQHIEEYYRLLYVAMTRARDELYIYGYTPYINANDMAWHTKLWNVFGKNDQDVIRITK